MRAPLAARAIIALAIAGILAFALWWLILRPGQMAQQAAQAKGEAAVAKGTADVATGALDVRLSVDREHARIREITKETVRVIEATPGADDPISPDLHRAGINALCLHDPYRADPGCDPVRRDPGGVGVAGADAGGTAAGE